MSIEHSILRHESENVTNELQEFF